MSKTTRCKMICSKVEEQLDEQFNYSFYPVADGSEENEKFFKYTPSGRLELGCTNKHGFEVGKEYYIDVSEA